MKRLLCFVGILLFSLSIYNCNTTNVKAKNPMDNSVKSPVDNNVKSSAETAIRSQEVKSFESAEENYANFCASCHGAKMIAFVDRKWKNGSSKDDLVKSIRYGIDRGGMPAYDTTFTLSEINELADYILTGIKDRKSYSIERGTPTPKYYEAEDLNLQVDTVINDLEVPWGIKVTKDGTIYFTERKGTFKIKRPDGSISTINNIPEVKAIIQGGMMDVALHPNFETNGLIYLSYSKIHSTDKKLCTTAVIRGRIENNTFIDQQEVFEALPYSNKGYHFGCRVVFDNDGFMYVSVGDRGARDENPQFLNNSCGKVHRLNDDGSIPTDNPFYETEGAIQSIWTYGNRNPQGMVVDKKNNLVWENEHGPRGGDELNLVSKGINYGWPTVSYGINYNGTIFTEKTAAEGIKEPINFWIPSIAPSGMAIVEGDNYGPWEDDILTGSLRFNYISRVKVDGDQVVHEEKILQDIGRVRSIEMGKDGFLYVGVEEPGRILKVLPLKNIPTK